MAFLYILRNAVGLTYVGVSRHPLTRLKNHNSASRSLQRHYTNRHRPWTLAAVFDGFATRAQALRAEYMVKHQPHTIRHPVATVARIATAQATCRHLLKNDHKFHIVKALTVVLWQEDVHQALTGSTDAVITLLYLG